MVNTLLSGYLAGMEQRTTRRSEVARAFNDFRSMYPNASYNDYRNYIDQLTGGDSYLRGAVPSDAILKRMAEDSARARAQREMETRLSNMRTQAQMRGTIEALAMDLALQYDDDAKLEEALLGRLGDDPSLLPMIHEVFPNGYQGIRQLATGQAITTNLPHVQTILSADPNADLGLIFPNLKGTSVLSSLQQQAQERIDREQEDRFRDIYSTEYTRMTANPETYQMPTEAEIGPNYLQRLISERDAMLAERARDEEEADTQERLTTLATLRAQISQDPEFANKLTRPDYDAFMFMDDIRKRAQLLGVDPSYDELRAIAEDIRQDVLTTVQSNYETSLDTARAAGLTAFNTANQTATETLINAYTGEVFAEQMGEFAGSAPAAIRMLGSLYDLTNPQAGLVINSILNPANLRSNNIEPFNFAAMVDLVAADPSFRAIAKPLAEARQNASQPNTVMPDKMVSSAEFTATIKDRIDQTVPALTTANVEVMRTAMELAQAGKLNEATTVIGQQIAQIDATARDLVSILDQVDGQSLPGTLEPGAAILPGTGEIDRAAIIDLIIDAGTALDAAKSDLLHQLNAVQQVVIEQGPAPANAVPNSTVTITELPPLSPVGSTAAGANALGQTIRDRFDEVSNAPRVPTEIEEVVRQRPTVPPPGYLDPNFQRPGGVGTSSPFEVRTPVQPIEPGNIDILNRPEVQNPDGSISTVRSISVNIDGVEVLIPTVSPNGRIMSDDEAVQRYLQTGEHLGKFRTPAEATAYANALHDQQDAFYNR